MTHTIPDAALFVLSHVASQLSYKWWEVASTKSWRHEILTERSTADWEEREWSEAVEALSTISEEMCPWWKIFRAKGHTPHELLDAVLRHRQEARRQGAVHITWAEASYPPLLRVIPDPPLGLTAQGELGLLDRPMLAVVGSRKASARAMHESFSLGRELAKAGVVVVSGGAYGCDIAAHQGVLAALKEGVPRPAPAVVVLAGGVDCHYPVVNEAVFRQLRQAGALFLSERLMGVQPRAWEFPSRNRIVAGLSREVVVMMAGERSGALITARLALAQGRDVAVLSHAAEDVRALGSAGLARDGAFVFHDGDEYLDARLGSWERAERSFLDQLGCVGASKGLSSREFPA